MSGVELLPCPFCGGPAAVKAYGRRNWVASCKADPDDATCPATIDVGADTRADAIAAWNTRAPVAGQAELARALTEAVRIIEQESSEWLDSAICCSGHDCGCRGSSNRDLVVHDLRATLSQHSGERS